MPMKQFGYAVCLLCVALPAQAADVENVVPDVPSYQWYRGCGPTAAGMVVGYWDGAGYDDLIDGSNDWSSNQANIEQMIASDEHVDDFWGTDAPEPWHEFNCVADFMGASRDPLGDGESYENKQHSGMTGYAEYRGYSDAVGGWQYYGGLWERFVSEIDAGRPMEFFVDPDGSGDGQTSADHYVTAFGYRYDGSDPAGATNREYSLYDPNYEDEQKWATFGPESGGTDYAIASASWFDPYDALPVADAGGPYVLDLDASDSVTLDGSGSSDADGEVAEWAWDLDGDTYGDAWGVSAEVEASLLELLGWSVGDERDITLYVTDDQGAAGAAGATTTLSYVPEPGVAALLALGLPAVLSRRRRRG